MQRSRQPPARSRGPAPRIARRPTGGPVPPAAGDLNSGDVAVAARSSVLATSSHFRHGKHHRYCKGRDGDEGCRLEWRKRPHRAAHPDPGPFGFGGWFDGGIPIPPRLTTTQARGNRRRPGGRQRRANVGGVAQLVGERIVNTLSRKLTGNPLDDIVGEVALPRRIRLGRRRRRRVPGRVAPSRGGTAPSPRRRDVI